jgi:hypothetical protein
MLHTIYKFLMSALPLENWEILRFCVHCIWAHTHTTHLFDHNSVMRIMGVKCSSHKCNIEHSHQWYLSDSISSPYNLGNSWNLNFYRDNLVCSNTSTFLSVNVSVCHVWRSIALGLLHIRSLNPYIWIWVVFVKWSWTHLGSHGIHGVQELWL